MLLPFCGNIFMDRFQKWYSPCHVKETRGYEGKAIDVGMRESGAEVYPILSAKC